MPLNQPVRPGQGAGRAITYATGSNAELTARQRTPADWATGEWRLLAGDEPPLHTHTPEGETVHAINGAIRRCRGSADRGRGGLLRRIPKNVPPGLTVRGEQARLLITRALEPGARGGLARALADSDANPGRVGIAIHETAPGI